jgi:hypothetical protein
MKKAALFILLIANSFYSNAQGDRTIYAFEISNINSGKISPTKFVNNGKNLGKKAIKQRLDSLDSEKYDSVSKTWLKLYRSVFQYDNKGNCVQSIFLIWDYSLQTFKNQTKYIYAFDGNGNQTLNEYYNWNETNNEWIFNYREEYTFDFLNNKLSQTNYNLNNNNEIKASHKKNYFYTNNKLDYSLDSNFDQFTSKWAIINKTNYTLNVNGNIITETIIWWDKTSNIWINSVKLTHAYDANFNETSKISYNWEGGSKVWKPSNKTEKSYDKNNNLLSQIESSWYESIKEWVNSTKDEYVYNTEGDLTQRISYIWTINWEISFDGTYTFNTNYLKNDLIVPLFFKQFNHMVESTVSSRYEEGVFKHNERGILYYSTVNVSGIKSIESFPVQIYPNPTNGLLNFDFKTNARALSVTITDVFGKIVKNINYENISSLQLDLSDLSNGIYFVNLQANELNTIYKIIKK